LSIFQTYTDTYIRLIQGALNPFGCRWTYNDVARVICRHDLDWLVSVLNGHATFFTDQEGADMDARWANDVRRRKEQGGWGNISLAWGLR
jgi:hypothetical protein